MIAQLKRRTAWWMPGLGILVIVLGVLAARYLPGWWRERQAVRYEADCRQLRSNQEWPRLAQLAEQWSQSDPLRATPWLFRAEAAAAEFRYTAAADFLFHVPRDDPKSLGAYMEGANILLGPANRPLEGVEALHRILKQEPRVADAHRHLIQFYALTLQRQKLLAQVKFAVENEREPPEAYVYAFLIDTLRLSNGAEMNTRWLQAYPDRELFLVARALHMDDQPAALPEVSNLNPLDAAKKTSAREQALSALARRFPRNVELLAWQIESLLVTGDIDRTIELLSLAPEEVDSDSRFWRYKGQVHESRNETKEAESAYRRALDLNPLDWSAMNRLATIERLNGRFSEVERLQKLVREADELREAVRKYPTAEAVGRPWLKEFQEFSSKAGNSLISAALSRRLGN